MDDPTRKSLLLTLRMTLGVLPRYLRHDLWRITEPQHGQAVDKLAEIVTEKIDSGFEVERKPPAPFFSFGHLYDGPKGDGEKQ